MYAIGDVPDKSGQTYFKQFNTLYLDYLGEYKVKDNPYGGDTTQGENTRGALALFNRAAAEATIKLTALSGHLPKLDAILINEFQTSLYPYVLSQRSPELMTQAGRAFILHSYDDAVINNSLNFEPIRSLGKLPANWQNNTFSLLNTGLNLSDVIMGDPNTIRSAANSYRMKYGDNPISREFDDPKKTSSFLYRHQGMHYHISRMDPTQVEKSEINLPGLQCSPLAMPSHGLFSAKLNQLAQYKRQNRETLYDMLDALPNWPGFKGKLYGHLDRNPHAKLFVYLGRLAPEQKGTLLYAKAAEQVLRQNPNAQFIVSSPDTSDLRVKTPLVRLARQFPGRFLLLDGWIDRKILMSGSDFGVFPSLFEPFGISHLEFMRVATPVIVHPVGGLASTVKSKYGILTKKRLSEEEIEAYIRYLSGKPTASSQDSSERGQEAEAQAVAFLTDALSEAANMSEKARLKMSYRAYQ